MLKSCPSLLNNQVGHHQHHISNTRIFYGELDQLPKSKQPLTQGDIEEMISLLVSSDDFGKASTSEQLRSKASVGLFDIVELHTKGGEFRGRERARISSCQGRYLRDSLQSTRQDLSCREVYNVGLFGEE